SLIKCRVCCLCSFFFQAEDGIRDRNVTGVQTCALPISVRAQPFHKVMVQAVSYIQTEPVDPEFLDPHLYTAQKMIHYCRILEIQIGRASCRERVWEWGGGV